MRLCYLKRAVSFGAALFLFPVLSFGSPKGVLAKKSETSKDIIEKAFNLSLQKDRPQAINILVAAIKQENSRGIDTSELKKTLEQISYIFYSERAQQSYELALSLKHTDTIQAQQKLSEATRLEPDNRSLVNETLRLQIIRGECGAALDGASRERARDPFDENLTLIQAQAQACLGKWDAYAKAREGIDIKKSPHGKFWLNLELEHNLSVKALSAAKENLAILEKIDPKYPELPYWKWRIATGKDKDMSAERYLKDCNNISNGVYRLYMVDVSLCRRVIEIETARKNEINAL